MIKFLRKNTLRSKIIVLLYLDVLYLSLCLSDKFMGRKCSWIRIKFALALYARRARFDYIFFVI